MRKEVVEIDRGEVIRRFLVHARRSVSTVSAFTAERGLLKTGGFDVLEADAREAVVALKQVAGQVDAVITSPPYATALPYIDTDRLSLIYLGLLSRTNHAMRDRLMIGNREVSTRMRNDYWETYKTRKGLLPIDTQSVIDRIHRLNSENPAGFRRKNLAALLSKYFFDMRDVLSSIRGLLRPGGDAFLVVGNNRTTAGGQLIQIRTADHLSAVAQDLGFDVVESSLMDSTRPAISSEKTRSIENKSDWHPILASSSLRSTQNASLSFLRHGHTSLALTRSLHFLQKLLPRRIRSFRLYSFL